MKMKSTHVCTLQARDMWGFPKLPPNASLCKRLTRNLRKFIAPNYHNARSLSHFHNRSNQASEAKRYATSPYFYVIHPFSYYAAVLEIMFFLSWLYGLLVDPLRVFYKEPFVDTFDYAVDSYFVTPVQRIVILSNFFLGYIDEDGQIVIDPKKIVKRYLTTFFIFDSIGTITYLFYVQNISSHLGFKVFVVLCSYARFNTILRTLEAITEHLAFPKSIQTITVCLLKTYLILHLCSCVVYAVPKSQYVNDWPGESWLTQANIHDPSDVTLIRKYLECLLVTVCHYFGASHNMYTVTLPIEQLCLSVITLIGRVHTLFLLADLLRAFGIASVSESAYEQQLSHLEEYMISKNLPVNLRKRLIKYYNHKLNRHFFNESEIFATLSEHLKTELFMYAARNLISRIFIFKALPKATLAKVISFLQLETYSPRDVIIKIGEEVSEIYFVSSGTVAVFNKARVELCHLEDSDEFGIISLLTGSIQVYQVEAVESTEVFHMNKKLFLTLIADHVNVIEQMNTMVQKRITRLKTIEENIMKGGTNVLSDLRNGNILEKFNRRPQISE